MVRLTPPSWIVGIGAGNLVPLIGVLFLGWDLPSILLMYWIETGVVGLINVLRIRRSMTVVPVPTDGLGPDGRIVRAQGSGGWLLPALWLVTYGVFWVILGSVVVQIVNGGFYAGASRTGWTGASLPVVVWGTVSLVAGQVIAYILDYVVGRRSLTVTPPELLRDPFVRIFVILATIAVGGVGTALTSSAVGFLAAMVIAKTAVEIWFARWAPATVDPDGAAAR